MNKLILTLRHHIQTIRELKIEHIIIHGSLEQKYFPWTQTTLTGDTGFGYFLDVTSRAAQDHLVDTYVPDLITITCAHVLSSPTQHSHNCTSL